MAVPERDPGTVRRTPIGLGKLGPGQVSARRSSLYAASIDSLRQLETSTMKPLIREPPPPPPSPRRTRSMCRDSVLYDALDLQWAICKNQATRRSPSVSPEWIRKRTESRNDSPRVLRATGAAEVGAATTLRREIRRVGAACKLALGRAKGRVGTCPTFPEHFLLLLARAATPTRGKVAFLCSSRSVRHGG